MSAPRPPRVLRLAGACTLLSVLLSTLLVSAASAAPAKLVVKGAATEGSALTVKPPKGAKLAWQRCAANGTRCIAIKSAVKTRYTLTATDVGSVVRVVSGKGKAQLRSKPTARIRPQAPKVTSAPTISGTGAAGAPVTTSPGTWTPRGRVMTFTYQWLRCSGSACTPIAGATNNSYVPGANEVGAELRADVSATTTLRGVSATSRTRSTTPLPVWMPEVTNVRAPTITGTALEGATLHAARGAWAAGDFPVATTIAWVRCAASCAAIAGATGDDYAITAADVGSQLRVSVTGAAGPSTATASSSSTARVAAFVPVNQSLPSVSPGGGVGIGDTLTAVDGGWTTLAPNSFTYQWQRCTPPGIATCVDIAGATSASYVTAVADATFTVRVRVVAHHLSAAATATSGVTQPVTGAGPTNTVAPAITGQAVRDDLLTASSGTFTGPGLITTAGQWQRCNASGTSCADIDGEIASSYLLGPADIGSTIVYAVTASNAWGTAVRASAATAVIAAPEPVNVTPPAVTGTLFDGGSASASTGTWTGRAPIAYTYQWQRCNGSGAACASIGGATSATLALGAADVAATLKVVVTATNAPHPAADLSATSPASGLVGASRVPALVTAPTITGTVQDGGTLTWHAGTYTGLAPFTMTRQWQRCDAVGANCVDVGGATGASYVLVSADVAKTIRVRERATNAFGNSGDTPSGSTVVVAAAPPTIVTLPLVTGSTIDGATLTAGSGSWNGSPTITYAYQWRRCDASGATCSNVGTGTPTYTLVAADVAGTVRVVVTATNTAGSGAPATSAMSAVIAAAPPVVGAPLPTVSGTLVRNGVVSTTNGTYTGTAPFTYTYQWQRCNAGGTGCANIIGATSANYVLAVADVGATVLARVTAHSSFSGATATASSAATTVIADVLLPPSETAQVAIDGDPLQGLSLAVQPATFVGTAPITHAYQWQRCDGLGVVCADVADVGDPSGATWLLGAADVGHTMRVIDTGTNSAGSGTSTSDATGVVVATAPAASLVQPAITGQLEEGATISTDSGTWGGSPEPSLAYQWQRCSLDGVTCTPIAGAAAESYQLVGADVGFAVRLRVSGANAYGSDVALSLVSSEVAPARVPVNSGDLPSVTSPADPDAPETMQVLSANDGTWTGTEAEHGYVWQRCDAVGDACVAISGATTASYTLLHPFDGGRTFRVVVTYTNVAGTDTATSPATQVVIPGTPPVANDDPTIDLGNAGLISNVSPATPMLWSGTDPITEQYEWLQCTDPDDEAACSTRGARGDEASYTVTSIDYRVEETWMRLRIWASNPFAPAGVGSALSNAIALPILCDSSDPDCGRYCLGCQNDVPPSIEGDAVYPGRLTANDGEWSGFLALTTTRTWMRCDSTGGACQVIPGATGAEYEILASDVGSTFMIEVYAHDSNGPSEFPAYSPASDVVQLATPPVNQDPPTISGDDFVVGTNLSIDEGVWTGLPNTFSFTYQWERCDAVGDNCVDISEATSEDYLLAVGDVGMTLRARVTADNLPTYPGFFATFDTEEETAAYPDSPNVVVAAEPPVAPDPDDPETGVVVSNTTDPDAPAPYEGQTLVVDPGTWGGTQPIEFAYQWQVCDEDGLACADIDGASTETHLVSHDEIGHTFRVAIVGINASATPVSLTSSQYPDAPLVVLAAVLPTLDGGPGTLAIDDDPERTKPFNATTGAWSGTAPLLVTQQWQRCTDGLGASCQDITGETNTTYTPTAVDLNDGDPYYLRLLVTGTNAAGAVTEQGPVSVSPVLPGTPPAWNASGLAPSITGVPITGATLSAVDGDWTGTFGIVFTYQWRRCNAAGAACHDILGETSQDYVPVADDEGHVLRVDVMGHNLVGVSAPESSDPVGPITP